MAWLIDVLLVLILVAGVAIGYRQGLVKMLISFLVIAVALGAAYAACAPAAEWVYGNYLEQKVSKSVDDAILPQNSDTLRLAVEEFLSGSSFGFVGSTMDFDAEEIMKTMTFDSAEQVAQTIKNDVIRPPALVMLKAIAFLFIFLVLWVVLSLLSRLISVGSKLPLVHGVDALAGSLLGLVICAVFCVGLCAIMEISLRVGSVGLVGFTAEMREQTVIYQAVSNLLNLK